VTENLLMGCYKLENRRKGATTFSITTLSIMTFSITTLSIMTFSIKTLSIKTFNITVNEKLHSA
jgi:hypothetical protein